MIVSLYKYPYIPFAENYYWIILAKVLLKRVSVSNMKKIGHELCTLERILHGNKFIRKTTQNVFWVTGSVLISWSRAWVFQ